MSDRVPPALARKMTIAAPTPVAVVPVRPSPQESWFQSLKLPSLSSFKSALDALPPQKRSIYVAVAVTGALSMGGLLSWYVYSLLFDKSSSSPTKNHPGKIPGMIEAGEMMMARTGRRKRISTAESNKSVPDGVLILHQCPRGRRTPCIAPYPLKLETFLRIHGIKYEVDFNNLEPRTSDAPWITLDLEDICDSENCMRFLVERYALELERGLTDSDKAHLRAYSHLLENHLYWGIALWRWVYDGARSLGEIQLLPAKTLQMIPQVCKTVEQAAWFHGIGKKSPRDVTEAVVQDLAALSHLLGKKPYFFGDQPSELDCTAFAMLAQMLWNMEGSPYEKAIKDKHKNLVEFCWRMRTQYWPDWESCLNNEGFEQ